MATKLQLATARIVALELQLAEDRQHLEAANRILAEENQDLRANLQAATEMITRLGGIKSESKTEIKANIVEIREELTVVAMRKALQIVSFTSAVSDEFLSNFTVWTNTEKNWVAFLPKVASKETARFQREFGAARMAKDIPGNYYKNQGCWFNVPVRK